MRWNGLITIASWSESPHIRRLRPKFASGANWRAREHIRYIQPIGFAKSANTGLFLRVSDNGPSKPGVPRSSRALRLAQGALSLSKGGGRAIRLACPEHIVAVLAHGEPISARFSECRPGLQPGRGRMRALRRPVAMYQLKYFDRNQATFRMNVGRGFLGLSLSKADPAEPSHRSPFASNVPLADGIVMANGRGHAVGSTVRA